MHAIKFALFAAIACCTVPAIAQWQWIDGQGRKVFSDRAPPADIPAKNILRSPGGARPAAPSAVPEVGAAKPVGARCGQRAGRAKAQEQEQEAAKAQADKLQKEKQRQDNCNRARQAKATLASGRLLSHVNAKGERGFMDEAARDAEIKRADAVIASDCGPMAEPAQ
jgi:hypothetical protein